ncbi:MAG: TrmH family RNA methyltransferase, partial [bacterium]
MQITEDLVHYLESYLTEHRKSRFTQVLNERTKYISVAVEDVYHLHNTSAVMRSCDVFGVQELHAIEEINQKRIDREIALGAQKWVDIQRHTSTKDFIQTMRNQGYTIVATTPHAPSIAMNDFNITQPTVFCFGRETEGISDTLLEAADVRMNIPMIGFTESLNVSVSAAIILQHFSNQLRNSDLPWPLTAEEKLAKRYDWCKKT